MEWDEIVCRCSTKRRFFSCQCSGLGLLVGESGVVYNRMVTE